MTEPGRVEPEKVGDVVKGWWQSFKELFFPPKRDLPQPQPRNQGAQQQQPSPSKPPAPSKPGTGPDSKRYVVEDQAGKEKARSDSLAEAHKQWQKLTAQTGRIIDTDTGEDVTPEPDDTGRYVVLDEHDKQQVSFDGKKSALAYWQDVQGKKGRVVDTETGEDLTPQTAGYLSPEQLARAIRMVGASKDFRDNELGIDPRMIQEMMRQLNEMKLPIYDIANVVGRNHGPTKKVTIKRRKVTIEIKKEIVEIDVPVVNAPGGRRVVPWATDDPELTRMRSMSEVTKISPRQLAVPEALRNHRIAGREMMVNRFHEEIPAEPTTKKQKVFQEKEVPKVEEWEEELEVSDEARSQLLEIVIDTSGSMAGDSIWLAIALAAVLIGKHLDDDSRYFYRRFETQVGKRRYAQSTEDKAKMIRVIVEQADKERLGGGTNITTAIRVAAEDVRDQAASGDQPEVLLITDGTDSVSIQDVYDAVGQDVVLHTANVGYFSNESLRDRSSTYMQLGWNGQQVQMSRNGNLMPGYSDRWYR
jgi:hypothetical protein